MKDVILYIVVNPIHTVPEISFVLCGGCYRTPVVVKQTDRVGVGGELEASDLDEMAE